jgi:hypothetical protein
MLCRHAYAQVHDPALPQFGDDWCHLDGLGSCSEYRDDFLHEIVRVIFPRERRDQKDWVIPGRISVTRRRAMYPLLHKYSNGMHKTPIGKARQKIYKDNI